MLPRSASRSRARAPVRLALALLLPLPVVAPAVAQEACPAGPVALVLSGGGAKGLAHVGALRVLDSAGFRPDLVVGTSMGSIIGALYASGVRSADLAAVPHKLPLAAAFRGYSPEPPLTFQERPAFLVFAEHGDRLELVPSAADQPRVNGMLTDILLEANLRAGGDFDRLPIPFRAVATDLRADTAVVLRGGDLARAVRASMSIPVVFSPMLEGDLVLVDGGMVANLPIAIARAEGARRVIAIDVSGRSPGDSLELTSPLGLTSRLVDLLAMQPVDSLGPADLYVRPDIEHINVLDFSPAQIDATIERGAVAARAALATLACPLPAGPWPVPLPLPARVGDVTVSGIGPRSGERLTGLLGLEAGGPLRLDSLQRAVRTVREREELTSFWLRPTRAGDTVAVAPLVEPPPRRRAVLGIAYDSDVGGRLWLGAVDRTFLGSGLEGSAAVEFGGLHAGAFLGLRRQFARRGIVPTATVSAERERVEFFADEGDGATVRLELVTRWLTSFGGVEIPWRRWTLAAGAEWQGWETPTQPDLGTLGAKARLVHVRDPGERTVEVEVFTSSRYTRLLADLSVVLSTGPWRVRPRVRAVGGDSDMPIHASTPLGGWDGFPGLPIGDLRGTREYFGSLLVTRKVMGPLRLGVEGAAGRQRLLAEVTSDTDDTWLYGGRLFAGFDTPLGPVALGWGYNSLDRERWMLRIGRWF